MTLDRLNMTQTSSLILTDLRSLTAQALPIVDNVFDNAKSTVRAIVTDDGRISGALIEANQTAAHGVAWLATYTQALHQMQGWADRLVADGKFGEIEQLIHQIAFAEYLLQMIVAAIPRICSLLKINGLNNSSAIFLGRPH